jgi:hypothetical protein
MKAIHCKSCNALIWDRQTIKIYYPLDLCPTCGLRGTLAKTKVKRSFVRKKINLFKEFR